jgi:hypothetical protein
MNNETINHFINAIKENTSIKMLRNSLTTCKELFPEQVINAIKVRIAELTAEREEQATKLGLTVKSLQLLKLILNRASWDFDEEGEGFILLRDLPHTTDVRGNLTDLKKKGFFKLTFTCDSSRFYTPDRDGFWVTLTQKGIEAQKALAA